MFPLMRADKRFLVFMTAWALASIAAIATEWHLKMFSFQTAAPVELPSVAAPVELPDAVWTVPVMNGIDQLQGGFIGDDPVSRALLFQPNSVVNWRVLPEPEAPR